MAPPRRTSAVVEGANYLSDLGIFSRRSKSGIGSILKRAINEIKDCKVDKTYASFLQDLPGFCEPQFVEKENEDDPTYMMFLGNLKECGNGYMLGVSIKHGVFLPIKYEVEDDRPAELKRKIPRSRDTLIRERRNLDLDNDMQSAQKDSVYLTRKRRRLAVNDELNSGLRNSDPAKENVLRRSPRIIENSSNSQRNSEINSDVSGDLRSDSQRNSEVNLDENVLRRSPRIIENSSNSQSEDTQSHTLVRKRRKSFVCDDELNSSLKKPCFGKENTTRHSSRVVEKSLDAKKKTPACKLDMPLSQAADESYSFFIAGLRVDGDSVYYESPDGTRVYYEEGDQQKSANDDDEPQRSPPTPRPPTPPSQPTPPPRLQTPPSDGKRIFYEGGDQRKQANDNDEPQRSAPTPRPRPPIPPPRQPTAPPRQLTPPSHGKWIFYEGGDQRKSANDNDEPQRNAPTPRPPIPPPRQPTPPPRLLTPSPRAQTDKDDSHMLSKQKKVVNNSKASAYSWFWKAVEKDLRRPFEKKEYKDLLEIVNARKPVGVHKETRSGGYKTEILSKMGNSYLDSYPDLKYEIEKAKSDPSKVLNLLRGFFFYLKKVPHGVPKPWKNEHCKTIMPGRA